MGLPIRVKGVDVEGAPVAQVTRSINVSPDGALFELEAEVERGMLLELSRPLPKQM
ncbi:MAG: hypothetical protein ACE5MK_06270 [Acidobacteriota bacterium]